MRDICVSTYRGLRYVSKLAHKGEGVISLHSPTGRGGFFVSALAHMRLRLVSALAHTGDVYV